MPRGNTRTTVFTRPHPIYAARGDGYEIEDVDGRRLIDLHGNYSTLVHGHRHPAVQSAIVAALDDGVSFGMPTEAEIRLAEALCDRSQAIELIRFSNSGTEAVMMAIRAARAFTGRAGVLRFERCYHGGHDAFLGTGAPGLTPGVAGEVVATPIGLEAFERVFQRHADRLAAVVLDLMPNRAGLEPMPAALVDRVRELTAEHGVLLIVDEIITFRLGTGGLAERYGVTPDLVTLGKLIGGGFPIGAFGGKRDIMSTFDPTASSPVVHGGTFTANPVAMRAGLAAVTLLDAGEIERINRLGDALRGALRELGLRTNGMGSLLRVLADDPVQLWWRLYEQRLAIANNGLIALSTVMTDETIDTIVERFAAAVCRTPRNSTSRAGSDP